MRYLLLTLGVLLSSCVDRGDVARIVEEKEVCNKLSRVRVCSTTWTVAAWDMSRGGCFLNDFDARKGKPLTLAESKALNNAFYSVTWVANMAAGCKRLEEDLK